MTTANRDTTPTPLPADQRAGQAAPAAPSAARRGKVEVSAHAIASIAAQAAAECYGVAGLTAHRQGLGAVQRLAPTEIARGVDVRFIADTVTIDLWVILEHRLRVVEVAHNVMVIVKYAVEQALGLHVAQVNVNIQALRVRK
jgi:uncharacterized alkaline shock family protein YloU